MACLHLLMEQKAILDCLIYVDTGFTYPETREMVNYVAERKPVHVVLSDRKGQNEKEGLPSDIVPVEWTVFGQSLTSAKPVRIQSSMQCCFENIGKPLLMKAKELGVTHLYYGQKRADAMHSISWDGDIVEGIVRLHPIEDWTDEQVLNYLRIKMTIPAHYQIKHSSLDCYDCTAFVKHSQDRLAWTKDHYPERYAAYAMRQNDVLQSLQEALA